MAGLDEVKQAKIAVILDGRDAQQAMKELTSEVKKFEEEVIKAYKAGDTKALKENLALLKQAERNLETFKKQTFDVDKVLKNLSGSAIKDLKKALKELNIELEGQTRGSSKYKEIENNMKAVQSELDKARGKAQQSGFSFKRMWEMAGGVGIAQLATKAIGWIKDGFTNLIQSSETLGDRFKFTMAGMNGALNAFKQSFITALEGMSDGIDKSDAKATHWYASALAGTKAFGIATWELIKGGLLSLPKAMEKAGKTFDDSKKAMNDAANAAINYEKVLDDLEDAENKLIKPRAEALKLLNEARSKSQDETLSIQERTKYLKDAISIEDEETKKSLTNQEIRVKAFRALKQSYLDTGMASQWTAEKERQLQIEEAKIFEIQTQSFNNKRRAENSLRALEKEAENEQEKKHKRELERLEEKKKAEKEYNEERKRLTEQGVQIGQQWIDQFYINEFNKLEERRAKGLVSEEEYQDKLIHLELSQLQTQLVYAQQNGLQTVDLEDKIFRKKAEINNKYYANKTRQQKKDLDQEKKDYKEKLDNAMDFGQNVGDILGQAIAEGENLLEASGKALLLGALDYLKKIMQLQIAEATMKSMVSADSIATFGIAGLAKAAILTGLIEAAYATVKGVIGYEKGNYPVVSDPNHTGLYSQPTMFLAGEKEPEIVISGPHTRNLMMNYPELVRAIYATRETPRYAAGNYPQISNSQGTNPVFQSDPEQKALTAHLIDLVSDLKVSGVKVKWDQRDDDELETRRIKFTAFKGKTNRYE